MTEPEEAFAIFCEDIRTEVGGKQSLMGTFGGDLYLHGSKGAPHVMRLSLAIVLRWPAGAAPGVIEVEITLPKPPPGSHRRLRLRLIPEPNGSVGGEADTGFKVLAGLNLDRVLLAAGDRVEVSLLRSSGPQKIGQLAVWDGGEVPNLAPRSNLRVEVVDVSANDDPDTPPTRPKRRRRRALL